jgi:hypothetical protein
MTINVPTRRAPAKTDTLREECIRICTLHLMDLRAAHDRPPPDVPLKMNSTPRLISPIPDASWCTSPARLCAELAE